ncbi:MAG: RagB/SusD family nutrient uptake outer membrane protein [Saprospiraceae bacterium]|nr:RagB/SusD family nutrient uptake outer membrane protein [Saprospiraceae bacterium]
MKAINNIFILTGVIFLMSSCENALNVEPKSVITAASMWQSEGDAVAALNGALSQFRVAFANDYIHWGEYRTGHFAEATGSGPNFQDMWTNTLDAQDAGTNWAAMYRAINDCNLILKYTPDISFSNQKTKDFTLATAHYLRGFLYFYIARVWGDAPVLTTGFESDTQDDLYPSRAPVEEVFNQVKADFEAAIALFPDSSPGTRKSGSRAAALMLKTDYYLWMAKVRNGGSAALNEAKSAIDQVLASTSYQLAGNFSDLFESDENNEFIFSINFARNEFEGGFAADWLVAVQYLNNKGLVENPVRVGSHQQWTTISNPFEDFLFARPTDTRLASTFQIYNEEGNQRFEWINKFPGEWVDGTRFFTSDIKVYRFAEAILFKAEIENALGNSAAAIAEVNKIAKRAYNVDNYYMVGSKEAVDAIILDERLREFAAEGKAWWDLIRFGKVFEMVPSLAGKENKQNILLWPVNISSINSNPAIIQTPGY